MHIAPFVDDMLKDEDIKDRKELSDAMFFAMKKYGGMKVYLELTMLLQSSEV